MAQVRQKHHSAKPVLGQTRTRRGFRLLTFQVSRKVYSAWNNIITEKCIDDAELATFLIHFYEENKKPVLCSLCSSPLEQVCPKCFYVQQEGHNELVPVLTTKSDSKGTAQQVPPSRLHPNNICSSGQPTLRQKDISWHQRPSSVSLDDDTECPETFADAEDVDSTYDYHNEDLPKTSQPNGQENGRFNKLPNMEASCGLYTELKGHRRKYCGLELDNNPADKKRGLTYQKRVLRLRMSKLENEIHIPDGERVFLDQLKATADHAHSDAMCSNNDTVETELQPDSHAVSTEIKDDTVLDHQTADIQSPADDIFTTVVGDFINESNGVSKKALKYTCRVCGIQFCALPRLATHAQRHDASEGIPFWCDSCQQGFLTMPDFTGHLCGHTPKNEPVLKVEKCQTPDQPPSSKQLSEKEDNHPPVSEPMNLQKESVDTQFELIEAQNVESRQDKILADSGFSVSLDNSCGKDQEAMVQDLQAQPPTVPNTITKSIQLPLKKLDRPFKCTHCSKSFRYASGLKNHSQKHTGEKAFPCPQCDKAFLSLRSRRQHQEKEHWTSSPITCQECKKQFKSQSTLDQHLPQHSEKPSFQCSVCQKLFKTGAMLRYHTRKHHRSYANFRCGYCEKVFYDKTQFDIHLADHSGLKAHLCSHCGEAFLTKSKFERHAVKHGTKMFACEDCGKEFYEKASYKKHKRTHLEVRPFPCPDDSCSLRFLTENLCNKHHATVHLRLRPHKCDTCGKAYPSRYYLNEHVRSQHTFVRPYKCPHCPKSFAKTDCRKQHMKTHKLDKADI